MNVFEKILERLETLENTFIKGNSHNVAAGASKAKEIVQEVEEEYNNGWIPCSEMLPEESGMYIVTCKDEKLIHVSFVQYQKTTNSWNLRGKRAYWRVIAWQPLPEPYQTKGE